MLIVPVYAVLCYTVAKHGHCLACRRRKSIPSTYNAFVASLELHGNKRSPVLRRISLTTMYFTLSQHWLCLFGDVLRMGAPRVPVAWQIGCWQTQPRSSKLHF